MKPIHLCLLISTLIFVSKPSLAEMRTFRVKVGTQPCTQLSEGFGCERAIFEEEKEVQIDLESSSGFSQVFRASQLSTPFDFYLVFGAKARPAHGDHLVQVFIYAASNGRSLATYVTNVDRIDDLNPINLKSGLVEVSSSEAYAGLVSISLVK